MKPAVRAFSLLEMIGVLAVLAILAAALVPALIRQMDKTAGDQESAALKSMGDALQQSIMRNRYIPGATDWAANIATELGVDVASVTNSPRQQPRCFLIDQNLSIGGFGLPYTQTSAGASGVTNTRVMLVSSIGRALPAGIASGVMSSNNFNAFWNWNDATSTLPTNSFAWTGWPNSDDLRVERIDLSPLFVRLVLNTYASITKCFYSIDSTNGPAEVSNAGTKGYFLQDSILFLYSGSSAGGTNFDSEQILIQNSAFLYYLDRWHGSVSGAALVAGMDIAAVVDQYMAAYPNARAQNTNQQAIVVQKMIDFMDAYSTWAAAGFPYTPKTLPPDLSVAQAALKVAVQGQFLANSYSPTNVDCQ